MSALPPKADIWSGVENVREVPKANMGLGLHRREMMRARDAKEQKHRNRERDLSKAFGKPR